MLRKKCTTVLIKVRQEPKLHRLFFGKIVLMQRQARLLYLC